MSERPHDEEDAAAEPEAVLGEAEEATGADTQGQVTVNLISDAAEVAAQVRGHVAYLFGVGFTVYQIRPIQKISHKYVKDDRVVSLVTDPERNSGAVVVLPKRGYQIKRKVFFADIESVVAAIAEETTGVISKSTSYFTQILVRMRHGSGEKDFLFNMPDIEGGDDDVFIRTMKELSGGVLPVTDLRREKNAPKDLRDWLNQQGLKE